MRRQWFAVDWDCSLGAGGEGEVFLGRCLHSGDLCAIKVSVLLDAAAAREQLARELEQHLRAAGDGVVGLIAWNLEAPRPFLVLELAHAGTLADEMREFGSTGRLYHPVRALHRTRAVLAALSNVHSRGLIHRDVKPANLLRFGEGLKITDFGAGRTAARSAYESGPAGTRLYAAPEQLIGDAIDVRADLYSVGCILYEMLTGRVPGADAGDGLPDPPPDVLFLPELDHLVRRLLQPSRARRPETAAEALELVDEALEAYERARDAWKRLGLGRSPY